MVKAIGAKLGKIGSRGAASAAGEKKLSSEQERKAERMQKEAFTRSIEQAQKAQFKAWTAEEIDEAADNAGQSVSRKAREAKNRVIMSRIDGLSDTAQ